MADNEPIFAFKQLFHALEQALNSDVPIYVSRTLTEIRICCRKLIEKKTFEPYSKFEPEEYSPEKLKDYKLYPLIKDKYKKYYESVVNQYIQCQKQSETAS